MKRLVKILRELLPVALLLCGVGLLVAAAWIISPVLGMVAAGLSLIGSALLMLCGSAKE